MPPNGIGEDERISPGSRYPNQSRYSAVNQRGQHVLVPIVIDKLGLYTRDIVGQAVERRHDAAQLQRFGQILGVEDGDDVAGGEVQAVIAGLRLGARIGGRNEHDRDGVRFRASLAAAMVTSSSASSSSST